MSAEQQSALRLACSDRQLAVIEGQAGTGKSTVLIGVARAHQAAGREILVTSTAALAAERLARELSEAGVEASSYSTAALHAALAAEKFSIGPRTTVIHEEAALASTREQRQLLRALEVSGARLIEVGDPRQSHAVGAGGLWPHFEQAARANQAHAELVLNLRAQHPADRRAQRLFREGQHELAIRYYDARGHVHVTLEQRRAEDHALEAAHRDRQRGMRSLVIAQASNEHLDELNARAQAIRLEAGELGERAIPVPGRPYQLRAGDEVQIRRSTHHPEFGQLRNGTTGQVLDIDPALDRVSLRLVDGRGGTLDREQLDRADVRLAYVQHPFPAQGHTSDTTHLIVAAHITQEGSYVALTRARHTTTIHASHEHLDIDDKRDVLPALAEHMSRTEPDLPSIATPLAHEQDIRNQEAHELAGDPRAASRAPTRSADEHDHEPDIGDPDRETAGPLQAADSPNGRARPHHDRDQTADILPPDVAIHDLDRRRERGQAERQAPDRRIAEDDEHGLGYEP